MFYTTIYLETQLSKSCLSLNILSEWIFAELDNNFFRTSTVTRSAMFQGRAGAFKLEKYIFNGEAFSIMSFGQLSKSMKGAAIFKAGMLHWISGITRRDHIQNNISDWNVATDHWSQWKTTKQQTETAMVWYARLLFRSLSTRRLRLSLSSAQSIEIIRPFFSRSEARSACLDRLRHLGLLNV